MDVKELKLALWNISREVTENINNVFYPLAEKHGLTLLQLQVLLNLLHDEEHTVGSLGRCMSVAGGNISNLCKKLEKEGLVERCRKTDDERVVVVTLSAKGRQKISEIDQIVDHKYELLLQSYPKFLEDIVVGLNQLSILLEKISTIEND